MKKHFAIAGLLLAAAWSGAVAQVNAGEQQPEPKLPFTVTQVTTLSLPWRIAFLPDGRMLITEKVGSLQLVTQQGVKTPVANVPAVLWQGQGGMLGVYLSPHYAQDHNVYLTYSEPGEPGGSSLALARAQLKIGKDAASLEGLQVIWRDGERGQGGQFGAQVAFSPDGKYLFLTVGDRQRMTPAQDPNQPLGKLLRLTLDGKPAPGNPMAGKTGAATVPVIESARGYGSREDSAGGADVHLSRPEPDAGGDLGQRAAHSLWPGVLRRMDGCGSWNMARAAAMS